MSKIKLLTIAVVALALLNILLVTALIIGAPPRPEGPKQLIIDMLHLDADQIAEYDVLIQQHQKQVAEKEQIILDIKKELYAQLRQDSYPKKDSLLTQLGQTQLAIEQIHFKHFSNLKAICRPDQLESFNELSKELIRLFDRKPLPPK
ncbi:MAG: periplasmic heavy metal sensor [Saprospiraceae bacterium]|nr:periplasmic heavy metal sensor [Saprospiraceae bacterium]